MKSFYSCIDAGFSTPSSLQHLAIREMVERANGKVVFYGSEEAKTLKSQAFMRSKLERLEGVDGICFFSLHQFRYGEQIDWDLLRTILTRGLELHFAREGISITSLDELERMYVFLYSIDYTLRPNRAQKWLDKIL